MSEEKVFYNAKQKIEYLEYIKEKSSDKPNSSIDKSIIGMFKRTAAIEESLNKDLCQMETDEIVDMIVSFNLSQKTSIFYKNIMHKYLEWCIKNNYSKVNFLDKRFLSLAEFKDHLKENDKALYINADLYDSMLEYLRGVLNYDYDGTIFIATYEGVLLEELAALRLSDIDRKNNIIKTDRGEIVVSPYLITRLFETSTVTQLAIQNRNRGRELPYKRYSDSVFSFINAGSVDDNTKALRRRLNKIRLELTDAFGLSKTLNSQDIVNSGILNYVIKKADENGVDIISDLRDKEYRYKYDVAERDYYYEMALKDKCLGYNIGLFRVRMEFLLENI